MDSRLQQRLARGEGGREGGPDAWFELGALVTGLDEEAAGAVDAQLEAQYGKRDTLWFEIGERGFLPAWVHPVVRPAAVLGREFLAIGPKDGPGLRRTFDARYVTELSGPDAVEQLLRIAHDPGMAHTACVRVGGFRLVGDQLSSFLASPMVRDVGFLRMSNCDLGHADGARRIAASPVAHTAYTLDLNFSYIHHDGVDALLAGCPGMYELVLGSNDVGMYGDEPPGGEEAWWDTVWDRAERRRLDIRII